MEQTNEKKREESREVRREVRREERRVKNKHQKATWDMVPTDCATIVSNDHLVYLVCPTGDIFSHNTKTNMLYKLRAYKKYNRTTTLKGRFKTNQFYMYVSLYIDGKLTTILHHRLIAKYFCENDDPAHKIYVDHIDSNTANNASSNLEWVTRSENDRRRREHNGFKPQSEHKKAAMRNTRLRAFAAYHERKRRLQEVNLFS